MGIKVHVGSQNGGDFDLVPVIPNRIPMQSKGISDEIFTYVKRKGSKTSGRDTFQGHGRYYPWHG